MKPLFSGEDIKKLIPQRPPIMMVDTFWEATDTDARTGLTIQHDNYFVQDGKFREPGLIEHIAQSASAFAGYGYFKAGKPAPIGYIGEIKKCAIHRLPLAGETLQTRIHILSEVMGVTLLSAETESNGEIVVESRMKISIQA